MDRDHPRTPRTPRTVADLKEGEEATVVRVDGRGRFRRRLLEMGMVRGTRLRLLGHAPLGDPLEVKVRGYLLALRRAEAREIIVEPAPVTEPDRPGVPPR